MAIMWNNLYGALLDNKVSVISQMILCVLSMVWVVKYENCQCFLLPIWIEEKKSHFLPPNTHFRYHPSPSLLTRLDVKRWDDNLPQPFTLLHSWTNVDRSRQKELSEHFTDDGKQYLNMHEFSLRDTEFLSWIFLFNSAGTLKIFEKLFAPFCI